MRLVQEHWRIRGELNSVPGAKVLVLEEARYPLPQLLKVGRGTTRICLMLHNAIEHDVVRRSLSARIKLMVASRMRGSVDYIAVHGTRQRELVERTVKTPVRAFALPGASYLNEFGMESWNDYSIAFPELADTFVCLGEIRGNKGIEVAIEAAKLSGSNLMVIGKAIDEPYLAQLRKAADGYVQIHIRDEFISAADFEYILLNCRALLLPYSQFNAQSGVLARAMRRQIRVVASDLASLREQAEEADHVTFFRAGSSAALAKAMSDVEGAEVGSRKLDQRSSLVSIPEWNEIAVAVQAGW